jgi:hypothetical protein
MHEPARRRPPVRQFALPAALMVLAFFSKTPISPYLLPSPRAQNRLATQIFILRYPYTLRMASPLHRIPYRSPWFTVLVGFLLRAAAVLALHTWRIPAIPDHYLYGAEVGRVARSLANGQGFLSPFDLPIPSAWLSPGYPLLLAGIFRIFGVYSNLSALIIFMLQCLAQAATAVFVYQIGRLCFSTRVALAAAWLWCLWPDSMPYAFLWIWETPVTVLLFTWTIVLTLRLRGLRYVDDQKAAAGAHANPYLLWALFGLAWGLISLFNPSLLLVLPVAGLYILFAPRSSPNTQPPGQRLTGVVIAAVIFLALFTPWMVRNQRVFHAFVPARTNLGVEFCLGNCHGIAGAFNLVAHPAFDPEERDRMLQIGELAYGREKMADAKAAIHSSPSTFVKASLYRAYFFWFGIFHGDLENPALSLARRILYSALSVAGLLGLLLAFHHRHPAAGFFLWNVLLIPLPGYFVILISTRFRNPLDPLLTLGAVYLFLGAMPSWRVRPFTR